MRLPPLTRGSTSSRWRTARPRFAAGLPRREMRLEVGDQELLIGAPAPGWYRQAGLAGGLSRRSGAADQVDAYRYEARLGAGREEEGTPGRVVTTPAVPATGAAPGGLAGPGVRWSDDPEASSRGPATTSCSAGAAGPASGWPPSPPWGPRSAASSAGSRPLASCHLGEPSVGALRRYRAPIPGHRICPPMPSAAPGRPSRKPKRGAPSCWSPRAISPTKARSRSSRTRRGCWAAPPCRSRPSWAITTSVSPPAAADILTACGLLPTLRPRARDLPGVRLVLGHSPVAHRHSGAIAPTDARDLARLASEAEGPVVVALHHPPSRWPVQTHYPPSIVWRDTTRLVDELAAANPATVIIAGHTHRNRRYPVRGLTVSEVASTKDYPGVWAGYSIYEGGIRQVVYRVAAPAAMAWTWATRRVLGGIWGWWSPGRLSDRCWTLEWPQVP